MELVNLDESSDPTPSFSDAISSTPVLKHHSLASQHIKDNPDSSDLSASQQQLNRATEPSAVSAIVNIKPEKMSPGSATTQEQRSTARSDTIASSVSVLTASPASTIPYAYDESSLTLLNVHSSELSDNTLLPGINNPQHDADILSSPTSVESQTVQGTAISRTQSSTHNPSALQLPVRRQPTQPQQQQQQHDQPTSDQTQRAATAQRRVYNLRPRPKKDD